MSESTTTACVILCPGQGAQQVGMGQGWVQHAPAAADTFEAAERVLGYDLGKLCSEGPADQLNRTDHAQVAIYVTSVACYRALEQAGELGPMAAAAGLSLGEFTALHLAGAFSFEDGLNLVRLRGQAMQEAAEAVSSGMVALIGADEDTANELCAQATKEAGSGEVLVPANFNCPGQVVVSGSQAACEEALKVAEKMELRATALTVAGAFHSPIMQPAADRLAKALDEVEWAQPRVAVYSNVTAEQHEADVASIKQRLIDQLTSPVRWSQSMERATQDHPQHRFIELAPGKVLGGLMRRIERKVKVENFAEPKKASGA